MNGQNSIFRYFKYPNIVLLFSVRHVLACLICFLFQFGYKFQWFLVEDKKSIFPVAVGEDSHAEGRERPAVLGRKIILAGAAVFFAAPTSPHDCVSSRGNRPRRE